MKCILCGKPAEKHKFKHGTLNLCHKCIPALTCEINGQNTTVAWIHKEDLARDKDSILSKEEAEDFTRDDLILYARHMEEWIVEGATWKGAKWKSLNDWRDEKEELLVLNTPLKELPLLIGSLKSKYNITMLEGRLKYGK